MNSLIQVHQRWTGHPRQSPDNKRRIHLGEIGVNKLIAKIAGDISKVPDDEVGEQTTVRAAGHTATPLNEAETFVKMKSHKEVIDTGARMKPAVDHENLITK